MPKKNINDIRIPSYDNLFSNEEQRQEAKIEKIMEFPINDIYEFKDHPFKVRQDEDLSYPVELGNDVYGNITRIDNVIDSIPKKLEIKKAVFDETNQQLEEIAF